jgi:multiple sugar transport system substrate-binding protein
VNTTGGRVARSIATLAATLLALSGCGGGGGGDGTSSAATSGSGGGMIQVWAHDGQRSENAVLQAAVQKFNSSQQTVRAVLKLIPGTEYTQTITVTKASALPDVFEFDGPTMANFIYNKKLSVLSSDVSAATITNATDSVKSEGTSDGKLYGLAMYTSGLGLYANKQLLTAAGVRLPTSPSEAWTAGEFTEVLAKLAAANKSRKSLDIQEGNGLATEWGTYAFSPIVWSAGGDLIKNNKAQGVMDSAAVVAALKTFQSWKPYVDPNADGNAFTKGRVALSWVGHWMYPSYRDALGSNLGVLPLPNFGNGSKTGAGSWEWGIGSATKNGTAAGKFLDFLLNDANVKAMTDANGAPPGTKTTLANSSLYRPSGPLALFSRQLDQSCVAGSVTAECIAVARPITAGYPTVTAQFSQAVANIWGGSDPQTALRKASKAIDTDFADNDNYQ